MSENIIRVLVSDASLTKCREHLIELLSSHIDKDLTFIEAILMKDLLDIGISTVKKVYVERADADE
jgi:hypothetical protein